MNKRTHIVIPEHLAAEIDALKGARSSFIAEAANEKLVRLRQMQALQAASGSWKDKDHPELRHGAAKWVKSLRRDYDRRLRKTPDA